MNKLSTIYAAILILVVQGLLRAEDGSVRWPVEGEIDLFSTFCDFRPLHFHGGIDIRTNGEEGREVLSPVHGYVWRIKYSYDGYGKGLYLKDNQGFIYVFGHLSRLSDRLEEVVKGIQYSRKRYYLDDAFGVDSIPVRMGELIAYSGQTGFGAPHIHFEKRTPDNEPLNPLTNGFEAADVIPPEIKSFALIYTDSSSIFPNGKRRIFIKPGFIRGENKYVADEAIPVRGPFGIEIKAFDRLRPGGPDLNIYRASLYIDDYLYFDVVYERYNYEQTAMVDLSYDYELEAENQSYWHLLFNPPGKNFSGSKSSYVDGGIFKGQTEYGYGRHNVRVEVYDPAGNMSLLLFEFILFPSEHLFDVEWVSDDVFYLHGQDANRFLDIAGVEVHGAKGEQNWRRLESENVIAAGQDRYKVSLSEVFKKNDFIRVDITGKSGWRIVDNYMVLSKQQDFRYNMVYVLTGGGILFDIKSLQKFAPSPGIDITYSDGYVKSIPAVALSQNRFAAYYKNSQISSRIIKIELFDEVSSDPLTVHEANLVLAGVGFDKRTLANSDDFEVIYDPGDFYEPALIEIVREKRKFPFAGNTIGHVYSTEPKTIPLAKDIEVSFKLEPGIDKTKIGIYRLNSKGEWRWIDSEISGESIRAKSSLFGTFAVLKDDGAPRVKSIYPPDGRTVFTPMPRIGCIVTDGLAKIESDENIEILLDGRWLIPEYDPETYQLKTYPDRPLEKGRHELVIKVTDRVGNERTVHTHFFVNEREKKN